MNFGHSSKIHLLTPEMLRKDINITARKATERSPKTSTPIEPHPNELYPKGPWHEFYCSYALVLHLKLLYWRAAFHTEANSGAGNSARQLHDCHFPACSLLLSNIFSVLFLGLSNNFLLLLEYAVRFIYEIQVVCSVSAALLMMNKSSSPQPLQAG